MIMMRKHSKIVSLLAVALCGALLFSGCGLLALMAPSSSGDEDFTAAMRKLQTGDYEEAIALCEQALEKGLQETPEDDAYNLMCSAYLDLDDYEKAIENGEKALALNDNNYICWTNLGIAYRMNGNYPRAIECYNNALAINPEYPEVLSSLGTLYVIQGDPEQALVYFEKAIATDPSLAVAHGNMALALAMLERFDDADKALKQAKALGYQNYDVIQERIDALKVD